MTEEMPEKVWVGYFPDDGYTGECFDADIFDDGYDRTSYTRTDIAEANLKSAEDDFEAMYQMVKSRNAEIERLKAELEVWEYAFDLCHRYNGNNKSEYLSDARKTLNQTEQTDDRE